MMLLRRGRSWVRVSWRDDGHEEEDGAAVVELFPWVGVGGG